MCAVGMSLPPQDDEELKERIGSHVEQVDMQQSVCESRQAVTEGDRLLAQQLDVSLDTLLVVVPIWSMV